MKSIGMIPGFTVIKKFTFLFKLKLIYPVSINPFNPPVPENGRLAGIQASKIQQDLAEAHLRFDEGDFDGAIKSYTAILERVPSLTALYLEIGHAYAEKQDFRKAQEAYESVPLHTTAAEEAATAIQSLKYLSIVTDLTKNTENATNQIY